MDNQDVAARRGIAELALKGFFDLALRWKLNRQESMTLLGLTATSTYANWKNGKTGTLPRDALERISYLLQIDDILRRENPSNKETPLSILHEPLSCLQNKSPIEQMLKGNVVDIYLAQQSLCLGTNSNESNNPSE